MSPMGFGGGFGGGMSPMGFGQLGGSDPMSVNNNMMALGQQSLQWNAMMMQMMNVMGMIFNMFMMKQMQTLVSQMGNFGGGGGGGGTPGVSDFLGGGGGGSASAGGTSSASGAPAVTNGNFGPMPAWATELGKYAGANANGPGGYCYKWVAQALRKFGVNVSGASAYMGADQLAKNPKFREVSVQPKDLPKLPAGAVVVWNKGPGHPHGHISIALGNGKEASDKLRTQITNYGTSVRVFLPK
jgi:hypothetical protein